MHRVNGGHVLIVEDDPVVGFGVRTILEEVGYASFAFAASSLQAVEQCRLRCPDLATVDLQLLVGGGLETAQRIEEECGPTPIVFVTGSPELVNVRWAVVVNKPFTAEVLARAAALSVRNLGEPRVEP